MFQGIPTPCLSSALSFYDGYRSEKLPANIIQVRPTSSVLSFVKEITSVSCQSILCIENIELRPSDFDDIIDKFSSQKT